MRVESYFDLVMLFFELFYLWKLTVVKFVSLSNPKY